MDKEITVPLSQVPSAKNWKVGGKYKLSVDVEQVGVNLRRDYDSECCEIGDEKKEAKPSFKTFVTFKVKNMSPYKKAIEKMK